jgi:hypothetical protein
MDWVTYVESGLLFVEAGILSFRAVLDVKSSRRNGLAVRVTNVDSDGLIPS